MTPRGDGPDDGPGSEPVRRHPARWRVVGSSGSGKSTLASAAAARLGVPHVELDAVFWAEGWRKREPDEALVILRDRLGGAEGQHGWVVDGNWLEAVPLLDGTDAIVWLDLPRRVVMRRLVTRTLRRAITREELWAGNRERPFDLLSRDPHRNVVLWSWQHHEVYRERYGALAATGEIPVVRLRSARDVRRWLAGLAPVGP
ncbi:hypothetical protein Cch01nite_03340 [Cellulomonas chitinilytica]|uniref:Adenylate kinase n=1 Tax=Cellulomonas chitinilytica TaxID=398759 RepID=A0A919TXN1_9CELL|nr:toxin [Cellulomonas chitinilytica]GIG19610.1 hypothetical protein Cch01nite_03340 [Cellulomonas chitinilytica]